MINCQSFFESLKEHSITFFAGVPDSSLKHLCAYITGNVASDRNIITANEGAAIALAVGHKLATGNPAMVYMQNSGQGNAVNPLISLADPDVYSVPLLMIIGWRGEPGKKDEPQHKKQGKITLSLLETMGIAHQVLPDDIDGAKKAIGEAAKYMAENDAPYALVAKKGIFEEYKLKSEATKQYELHSEAAIKLIVDQLDESDIVVSTTGKISRELFEIREELKQVHSHDFLTVGSMGHTSHIALAIALEKKDRLVYCLDGDGAVIMHMGALPIVASVNAGNLKHIVINNGAHSSVGGQPTVAFDIDLIKIAEASGYENVFYASSPEDIVSELKKMKKASGSCFMEIRVNKGSRADLGRPTTTPVENKQAFMKFLK